MGFGPQVVDLNGDGYRDIITGSWPWQLYIFRGTGDSGFATAEPILAKDGSLLNAGKASVVHAAGWDDDGDLDLLVGNISGQIHFIPNEGTARSYAFGEKEPLSAGGSPIRVDVGDAGPFVTDWDGDGRRDLLTGTGRGDVWWYRNIGKKGHPQLAPGRELVNASRAKIGKRTKIAVADWNGDGFIPGLSSESLVRIEFDGTEAREAERFDMGKRIRAVEQGPNGAIWLLEDRKGGRLLKLTPR